MLKEIMSRLVSESEPGGMARLTLDIGGDEPVIPMNLSVPSVEPEAGEGWKHYKERVSNVLGPTMEWLKKNAGLNCIPVHSSNALQARGLVGEAWCFCHRPAALVFAFVAF